MQKIYVDENIFYIEDFLSEESFISFSKMCEEYDSNFEYKENFFKNRSVFDMDSFPMPYEYTKAWDEFISKMNDLFTNDIHHLGRIKALYKFDKYDAVTNNRDFCFGRHSDDHGYRSEREEGKEVRPSIFFGANYYINDNYDGGEIYYNKKDISIKPKRNSLVCHPGSEEYEHEVTQIFNTAKYTIPCFAINNLIR